MRTQATDNRILLEIDEWLAFLPHRCLLPLDILSVFLGGFPLLGSGVGFSQVDRQDEVFTLVLSDALTVRGDGPRFTVQDCSSPPAPAPYEPQNVRHPEPTRPLESVSGPAERPRIQAPKTTCQVRYPHTDPIRGGTVEGLAVSRFLRSAPFSQRNSCHFESRGSPAARIVSRSTTSGDILANSATLS
jgi:hypothetical protein